MVWALILAVYLAPDNAVNWNGPWKIGKTFNPEKLYVSEAECRNDAIQIIGRVHQGMLAPIRFQCVALPAGLLKGAPR